MSWQTIINQERVKKILQASLDNGRIAHAYLFSGPDGVGKSVTAIELAKIFNCDQRTSVACEKCASCKKFDSLQHPNLNIIVPLPVGKNEVSGDSPLAKLSDEEIAVLREQVKLKAGNPYHDIIIPKAIEIKVNSIREIRRGAALTAVDRGKKIFLIIHAEAMNDTASNALLKTLEEPPADTILILTTSCPDGLLPTIVSRCQQIRFDALSDDAVEAALLEREHSEPSVARTIARLAKGNYTKALQYLHESLGERRTEAVELLRTILLKSRSALLEEIERLVGERDKQEIDEVLQLMQHWLRDAMLMQAGMKEAAVSDDADAFQKFIRKYPAADFAAALNAIDTAISLLYKNVYIPLILIDLAFRLRRSIDTMNVKNRASISANATTSS